MVPRLARAPVVSIWIGHGERNSRSLNDRSERGDEKDRASLVNRRQTLCDKRENNFVWKNFPPNFTPLKTDLFVKHQKTLMLIEDYSYSSGTFFTQKRLSSVLFFPPSCCVNLLILQGDWETARSKSGSKERNNAVLRVLRGASSREGGRGGGGWDKETADTSSCTIYSSLCFVPRVYYAGTFMSPSLLLMIAVL